MPYALHHDVELYHEAFGDPSHPALLLVNGLGSQCINFRTDWCEQYVAAGFHVVRFDNRDVGLSSKLDRDYTLSDMAADAVAVLDAVGVDRVHAVGVSLGGMVVQTLAIEHPERLRSLTSVMSTTGDADVGQSTAAAQNHLLAPPAPGRDAYIAGHLAGLRIWGSPGLVDEAEQARFAGEAYDRCFHPAGVGRQLRAAMASGSRSARLASVAVPALVIHGTADTLIDPSGGRRTAEVIPGARLELIEGMGHDYPRPLWPRWVQLIGEHARAADAA